MSDGIEYGFNPNWTVKLEYDYLTPEAITEPDRGPRQPAISEQHQF
jgi:hypothetical protein